MSSGCLNDTVMKNVKEAFHLIHQLGVIHGDVRKENILVRADDSVMIIDFDMANFDDLSEEVIAMEDKVVDELLGDLEKENDSLSVGEKIIGEDFEF